MFHFAYDQHSLVIFLISGSVFHGQQGFLLQLLVQSSADYVRDLNYGSADSNRVAGTINELIEYPLRILSL